MPLTAFQTEIYGLLTYRWQTVPDVEKKLEAQRGEELSRFIGNEIIMALRALERQKLVEKQWLTAEPTAEDMKERGGARRRVYRKSLGGTEIREPVEAPDNLQPSLA